MKSSTKSVETQSDFSKEVQPENIKIMSKLEDVIGLSPEVLERTAFSCKALVRKREIKQATDLLRIVFAYVVFDWSMRYLGLWCVLLGIGSLSDVAVRKRLQACNKWLGKLIALLLRAGQINIQPKAGVRLRLQDATVISKPGSTGTDFRIHLSLNMSAAAIDGINLTDQHTGETLAHFPTQAEDIRIGDRGYAYASSLGPVLADGRLVVRNNWQNLPLKTVDGKSLCYKDWLSVIAEASECKVTLETPNGTFLLRAIACPLPPEKAEEARRRARAAAMKKKHTVRDETLLAAGFVLVVTNLPVEEFDTMTVLSFYRIRWQIELLFKRLKSLLALDGLRSKDERLGQTYLLGKMLVALLIDRGMQQVRFQAPDWFTRLDRPASLWRLTILFLDCFRDLVRGTINWEQYMEKLSVLERYFCSSPRKRTNQLANARALLANLAGC